MKKWLKLTILPVLFISLAACGEKKPQEAPVENAPVETTQTAQQAETTQAPNNNQDQASNAQAGENGSQATEGQGDQTPATNGEYDAKGQAGTATITIHKDGQEAKSYKVNNIGDVSIKDTMAAITDIKFSFNENEGVIDEIEGVKNDYEPNTWMYLYNEAYAELGVVSQTLKDGDKVDWYFGTIEDLPVHIVPAE